MKKRGIFVLICFIFLIVSILAKVNACGCGMAIADMKVFNSLKETQAYLMIDIKDQNNYNEMPFFRMVSMEEAYNVTIVFPIDGVPVNVSGKKITAEKFLEDYKINDAETYIEKQSFSGLANKFRMDMKAAASPVFALSNGFVGLVWRSMSFGVMKSAMPSLDYTNSLGGKGLNPIAHYEFEGGSMDIYDVKSMDTLGEFVKKINITLTGEVEKLVTKYNNYYVAVLYLNVPSVISEDMKSQLKSCPDQLENVKEALQTKTEFSYDDIWNLTKGDCEEPLRELIFSVTNGNSDVNGTLVDMEFTGTNKFFYPTSIVNSYKYPVTDQKYFIKTPESLNIKLESSKVDKIAVFDSERWYTVKSTEDDIKGKIIVADTGVKFSDFFRKINQALYENTSIMVLIIYLIIIMGVFVLYYFFRGKEKISRGDIGLAIGMFFIAGLVLAFIVMLAKKKFKFALAIIILWIILLLLMFI